MFWEWCHTQNTQRYFPQTLSRLLPVSPSPVYVVGYSPMGCSANGNSVLGSAFWQQRELVNLIFPNSSFSQIYLTPESVFQRTSFQPVVLMGPFDKRSSSFDRSPNMGGFTMFSPSFPGRVLWTEMRRIADLVCSKSWTQPTILYCLL